MLRNCQHFTTAIMAPVEISVKLMSAFMYRRPLGLVSLLTVRSWRVAAAKTGIPPGYVLHQHITKCRYNPCCKFLTAVSEGVEGEDTSAWFSTRPEMRNSETDCQRLYRKSVAEQESECRSSQMKSSHLSTWPLFTPFRAHKHCFLSNAVAGFSLPSCYSFS